MSSSNLTPRKPRAKSIAQLRLARRTITRPRVIFNGQDVTPQSIPPGAFKAAKERHIEMSDVNVSATQAALNMGAQSRLLRESSFGAAPAGGHNSMFMTGGTLVDTTSDIIGSIGSMVGGSDAAGMLDESSTETASDVVRTVPMPEHISLIICETPTVIVLDLPSSTVEKDSTDGELVETDNKLYEYITEGKGKNRKMVHAIVQTVSALTKTKFTEAPKIKNVNDDSYVSLWALYDTYYDDFTEKVEENVSLTSLEKDQVLTDEDKALVKLSKNARYMDSVCIMQRILANNVFNTQQKRFCGLNDPDPFREGIEYNYRLNYLWTFSNADTKDRCVSALCINKVNKDIIAVGYGKFYYDEDVIGLVFLWNIKNPVQPEREYIFQTPVTALDFSNQYHNFLAIGFYNGDIIVIDVSYRDIHVIAQNCKATCMLYEPIWQLSYYTDVDYYKGQEFFVATCQNGRITKFRLSRQSTTLHSNHMMRITAAEGKLKGVETLRKCASKRVSICRHSPALVYAAHPIDPRIYYISTSEGIVHKCSKNYYHQHLDLFLAHDGPMYSMEFSPFCNKLFLTCGDDWAIRLWADGISEPLFEIKKRWMGVQGVAWSPSHSTIIASISGNEIFIWDLQRKTYDSQSATVSPTKSRNTLLKFTDDGRCLLVADIDGNVHVFSLEDMPFAAYFQENLLTQSIRRALVTRPDLINSINKLDGLSFSQNVSY